MDISTLSDWNDHCGTPANGCRIGTWARFSTSFQKNWKSRRTCAVFSYLVLATKFIFLKDRRAEWHTTGGDRLLPWHSEYRADHAAHRAHTSGQGASAEEGPGPSPSPSSLSWCGSCSPAGPPGFAAIPPAPRPLPFWPVKWWWLLSGDGCPAFSPEIPNTGSCSLI